VAAFSAARFQPGEVDGRQVRSLIRIEVVFEPRATSVPGAVVVSRQNL
jgi:soluble lytic murein transglycosylase-like protein